MMCGSPRRADHEKVGMAAETVQENCHSGNMGLEHDFLLGAR